MKDVKTILNDEEYLRQISKEVDFNNKQYLEDIEILKEFCLKEEVFAMAAIQLGIPYRMIYLKMTRLDKIDDKEWNEAKVLINPVIKNRKGLTKYWEACASCLDNMGLVERPYEIELEYYDEFGEKYNETFNEFVATVLSHEYDHLDGILHIDIALEVLNMPKKEREEYRKTHNYEIISKDGNYDELKKRLENE